MVLDYSMTQDFYCLSMVIYQETHSKVFAEASMFALIKVPFAQYEPPPPA